MKLQDEWDELAKLWIPEAGPNQTVAMKAAFYAGAFSVAQNAVMMAQLKSRGHLADSFAEIRDEAEAICRQYAAEGKC